jgi:Ribbon-helix-helix protein, copG family
VRTTLTLDDDVAARLQAEARRSGRPFKVVVNEHLRAALTQRKAIGAAPAFRVAVQSFGGPVRGLAYDDIGTMLEVVEGSEHR